MIFREASPIDIPQMQVVRHTVKENILSDPALVTDRHYEDFITNRGKGWVCETGGKIVGFAIADLHEQNVWALFLRPEYEGKGIGKRLHTLMLEWYFEQTTKPIWLGTEGNTRAAAFYRRQGWTEVGRHGTDEIKFEMTCENWKAKNKKQAETQ